MQEQRPEALPVVEDLSFEAALEELETIVRVSNKAKSILRIPSRSMNAAWR
jgi:hypothetical protein